jgi:hypothetical protein
MSKISRPVYVVLLVRGARLDLPVDVGAVRGTPVTGRQVDQALREARSLCPSGTVLGSY